MRAIVSKQPLFRLNVSLFFGLLSLCVLVSILLVPQRANAEYIETFISDITVNPDASISVQEDITYVFNDERHGIYRCIPIIHPEKASSLLKERYIDILFTEVAMDGKEVPFIHTERDEDECLKVGDPNATITGPHTYQIVYHVYGAISYQPNGGADLYWNVTGNGWEVPMRNVVARVTSSDGILMRERACYQGPEGKTDSCGSMTEGGGAYIYADSSLGANEGVTIAQAVNRTKIAKDIRERYKDELLWVIGIIVGIASLGYGIYRYKTKFKTGKTIVAQYEPYPGVKPMYAGLLMDGRLDPRDITACIVYLAQKGFIKIKKIEKKVLFLFEVDDYEITLLKSTDSLDSFERDLISLLFSKDAQPGAITTLGDLRESTIKRMENVTTLRLLREDLESDLEAQGYFQHRTPLKRSIVKESVTNGASIRSVSYKHRFATPILIITLIVLGAPFLASASPLLIMIVVLLFLGSVMFMIFSRRRTSKGYEALDHLKGFKDFLSVTDRERFIFHNAPQKSPEQFMEFLPYAIAFGVEKQWAKTFEGITIPNPSWYDGGGVGTFNAVSLSQSLGGFSTAFAASSGTSASSGGGSSGGGSGGGGGGSW